MMEEKKNPVLTVYDEESGKYFDITIDLDLLENAELSEEEIRICARRVLKLIDKL